MELGIRSFRGLFLLLLVACIQLLHSGVQPVAAVPKQGMRGKGMRRAKGMHKKGGMHRKGMNSAQYPVDQRIASVPFGVTPEGAKFQLYSLRSGTYRAQITNYGATLVRMLVPKPKGGRRRGLVDVVSGYDNAQDYLTRQRNNNHGCIIGRYANRISGHSFKMGQTKYVLEANDGNNTLHSGESNYCTKVWGAYYVVSRWGVSLILNYTSPDGQGGFPGTLKVTANYTLFYNRLTLIIEARTDKNTHVNLVHHPYFNLRGVGPRQNLTASALQHQLQLNCARYTPPSRTSVLTGEIEPVAGTPFDFRMLKQMGAAMAANNGSGFDNNFVVNIAPAPDGTPYPLAAILRDPVSRRELQIYTNQPGMQLYTANHFSGKPGKGGVPYPSKSFIALEAQHFPDTPNKLTKFPTTFLRPGAVWKSVTIYEFRNFYNGGVRRGAH